MKIDKNKFAQAVLISEKGKLTLEEKLELYIKAISLADAHNKNQPLPKINDINF